MLRTPVVVPRLWVPNDLPLQHTSTKAAEHAATTGHRVHRAAMHVSIEMPVHVLVDAHRSTRHADVCHGRLTLGMPCSGPRRPPSAVSRPAGPPAAPCWRAP